MLSPGFRYSVALFCAGLVWAGLRGSAHADEPVMAFDGAVEADQMTVMPNSDPAPPYALEVFTPQASWAGLAHFGLKSGGVPETYPRVATVIRQATPNQEVGPGQLIVRGPSPDDAPVNRISLEGDGQTQFAGGPVIIGRVRVSEGQLLPAKGKLNVYSDDRLSDVFLSPGALHFEAADGAGYISAGPIDPPPLPPPVPWPGGTLYFQTAGQTQMTITDDGNIGIGLEPAYRLDVLGPVCFRSGPAPESLPDYGGLIYAKWDQGDHLYAWDDTGNETILTPHTDPRSVAPQAQSSFSDPTVALPFSFDHKNYLVGKGEVVDMAKMVAYVEQKMQTELGEEAGRLKYTYDLPEAERTTIENCDAERVKSQAEAVMQKAETMPWIKVELSADGGFPREAIEEVPETAPQQQLVTVRKQVVDFESARIVTLEHQEMHEVAVPTGRMTKQFKKDWKLENGVLYRRPTVDDVNIEDFVKPFTWPQWIVDRVPGGGGQQISQSASQLIGQIKAMLAQLAKKDSSQVAEAKAGK